MEETKIIKLNIESKEESTEKNKKFLNSCNTNPIVQKMIKITQKSKLGKFTLKDLI